MQGLNLNNTTPSAPTETLNVAWQADPPSLDPTVTRNVSANVPVFTGDSGKGGAMGLVPAPAAGDAVAGKVLKADGTWYVPAAAPVTSVFGRTGAVVAVTGDYSFSEIAGAAAAAQLPLATTAAVGAVKPDGSTIVIDGTGKISAAASLSNPMTAQGDIIVGGASGVPTRLAAGTAGQVLTSGGAGVEPNWAAGGVGGSIFYYAAIDVPPATANAMDDEFTGSSLDPKWTQVYTGTPVLNFYGGTFLQVTQPASGTDNISSLYQTAPTAPYAVTAKVLVPSANENYHYAGLAVRDSGTGKWVKFSYGTQNWNCSNQYWSAQNTYASSQGLASANYNAPVWIYLRIEDDGTNLKVSYSVFGNTWIVLFSASRTAWLANPNQIGLHWGVNTTASDTAAVFDWFRRTA